MGETTISIWCKVIWGENMSKIITSQSPMLKFDIKVGEVIWISYTEITHMREAMDMEGDLGYYEFDIFY